MGTSATSLSSPSDTPQLTHTTAMSRLVLCLALLCGLVSATQFQDCGSVAKDPSFSVASCDTPPCSVKAGSKFPIMMSFTPDHDISDLTAEVDAVIGGAVIHWPGFDTAACKYMQGEQCPLKAGQKATWQYEVYVEPAYPKMTVQALFMLKDGDAKQICASIPVIIS